MAVKVVVHRSVLVNMHLPNGQIGRSVQRAAGRIRDRARRNVSVDTGLLRRSITSKRQPSGPTSVVYRIGSDVHYAPYQEHGTGPIYARRAPLLVFKIGNRWVRTFSTRGVPAQHYLKRAADSLTIADFE